MRTYCIAQGKKQAIIKNPLVSYQVSTRTTNISRLESQPFESMEL